MTADKLFQLPPAKGKSPEGQFAFRAGTKKYTLPQLQHLPISATVKMSPLFGGDEMTDAEGAAALVGLVEVLEDLNPDVAELVRTLETSQFWALFNAWSDASQVEAGESEAS